MRYILFLLLFTSSVFAEIGVKQSFRYDSLYVGEIDYELGLAPSSITAANKYLGTNSSSTFGLWSLPTAADSQTLTLFNDSLSIFNGNSVYLGNYSDQYFAGSGLSLSSGTFSTTNIGIPVDLEFTIPFEGSTSQVLTLSRAYMSSITTSFVDSDKQELSYSSGTFSIENGNSIDFTTKFLSQSSATVNCTQADYFILNLTANSTIALQNMVTGTNYFLLIKNNHPASSSITVTFPATADILPLTSITLLFGRYVEVAVIYTGTYRVWAIGNILELHE